MFKNMKLGLRLALGFSIVLILMTIIIVLNMYEMQISSQKLEEIVKKYNYRTKISNHIIDDARETSINVRNILLEKFSNNHNEKYQRYIDYIEKVRKNYSLSMIEFKKLIPENDKKLFKLFNDMSSTEAIVRRNQDHVIKLALEGAHVEATSFMFTKAYPSVEKWIKLIDSIIDCNDEQNSLNYNETIESKLFAQKIMVILGITILLISVAFTIFLSREITIPLTTLVKASNRIASGDLTIDLSADEKRGDEIGLLMQSLNKMILALRDNQDLITSNINERKVVEENFRSASIYTRNLIEASLDPLVTRAI